MDRQEIAQVVVMKESSSNDVAVPCCKYHPLTLNGLEVSAATTFQPSSSLVQELRKRENPFFRCMHYTIQLKLEDSFFSSSLLFSSCIIH
jgi:hypothetical protein